MGFNPPPLGSEGLCLYCSRKLHWVHHFDVERVEDPKRCGRCGAKRPADLEQPCGCGAHVAGRRERRVNKRRVHAKPGPYGDGHFCSRPCGFAFAVTLADLGRRLAKKPEQQEAS